MRTARRGLHLSPDQACPQIQAAPLPGSRPPRAGTTPPPAGTPPLWTEFLTHASENITLPQTSFAGGNNKELVLWLINGIDT